jgi:hypothetical protein
MNKHRRRGRRGGGRGRGGKREGKECKKSEKRERENHSFGLVFFFWREPQQINRDLHNTTHHHHSNSDLFLVEIFFKVDKEDKKK